MIIFLKSVLSFSAEKCGLNKQYFIFKVISLSLGVTMKYDDKIEMWKVFWMQGQAHVVPSNFENLRAKYQLSRFGWHSCGALHF